MGRMQGIAAACVALGLVAPACAEPVSAGSGGMVLSRNCDGFMTEVPARWVLDNAAATRVGIDMFFYPEGTPSPERLRMPVYAYVMPTVRGSDDVSAAWLAQSALQDYPKDDPQARMEPLDVALHPRKGLKAAAYRLTAPAIHKYEAIAYVESPRAIFAVTLSANSAEALTSNRSFVATIVDAGLVTEPAGECTATRQQE